MSYVPPQIPMMREDWPTLKEMLDSEKRLVIFIDKGADEKTLASVPYLLPQFTMVCTNYMTRNPFFTEFAATFYRCGKMNTIPLTVNFPAKSTALWVLFHLPSNST
jgi:hypothetical protein